MIDPSQETLPNYVRALYAWLGTLQVDYGNFGQSFGLPEDEWRNLYNHPIFRVFSGPERATSDIRSLLIAQGFIAPDAALDQGHPEIQYSQRPMPMAVLRMADYAVSTELHLPPVRFMTLKSDGLMWKRYRWPTPFTATVSVEFMSKKQFTWDFIFEWLMGQFTQLGAGLNRRYLAVDFPQPYGTRYAALELEDISDNSDLEVSEGEERLIRKTVSLRLSCWDFDLIGEEVPAVADIDIVRGEIALADFELGVEGPTSPVVTGAPSVIYSHTPPPWFHFRERTTATLDDRTAPRWSCDGDSVVETASLPFKDGTVVTGEMTLKCATVSGSVVDVAVRVCSRDNGDDGALTVLQTFTVTPDETTREASFTYRTYVDTVDHEVSIQLQPVSEANLHVVSHVIARVTGANAVASGDRTQSNIGASRDVTVSGLTNGRAYAVRAVVPDDAVGVTLTVYGDGGATETLSSATGTGEIVLYVAPTAGMLLLRFTASPAAPTLTITGITVSRTVATPL